MKWLEGEAREWTPCLSIYNCRGHVIQVQCAGAFWELILVGMM